MVGNTSNYNEFDVLRALLKINANVSRAELCKSLELGEGSIRGILNELKSKKLITSTKQGHSLSNKGKKAIENILKNIGLPKKVNLKMYEEFKKVRIIIKNIKNYMQSYRERDVAVKNGAEGAIILTNKNGKLDLGFKCNCNLSELEKDSIINKDDIMIVAWADSYRNAENSALAAAMSLKKISI